MNTKMVMLMESVRSFFKKEEGASAIEYALIAGLIAVVMIVAVGAVGDEIVAIFKNIMTQLQTARS